MATKVNVYKSLQDYQLGDQQVVARVQYNQCLDVWTGSNWQNGGVGVHLGITRLQDGRHVLIRGSQWDGDRDYGYVVSDRDALDAILKAGCEELLEEPRFASLKDLAARVLLPEMACSM